MKKFAVGYGTVGMLLAVSVGVTGTYGLSKTDREIYDTAMNLEEQMQENGFMGFAPEDYKIRFFNGKMDYVVADGKVTEEEAAFDTFVGTTTKIAGAYQVIIPTYDHFSGMISLLNNAQNVTDGEMTFGDDIYSTNAHVATLWHEAFHAWQMTNWEGEVEAAYTAAGLLPEDDMTDIVLNEVDSKETLVVSFSGEMKLLQKAYETENVEKKKQMVADALKFADEREAEEGEKAAYAENYFEMMEGSARYIEAEAYRRLEGEEAWRQVYLGTFTYTNGTQKYYTMGMYKCYLLDELMPEWKDDFCVTDTLDDYLHIAVD